MSVNPVFLTHFDGADGSTSAVDISDSAHGITFFNGAALSTAQKKFGPTAAHFDGTDDRVQITGSLRDFEFGSGDFTFETFVYLNSIVATAVGYIYKDVDNRVIMQIGATGVVAFWMRIAGVNYGLAGSSILSPGAWYHLVWQRRGGTFEIYIDGVSEGNLSGSYSGALPSGVTEVDIGARIVSGAWGFFLNGYIDELRVVKGQAVYAANFTPPSVPFTAPRSRQVEEPYNLHRFVASQVEEPYTTPIPVARQVEELYGDKLSRQYAAPYGHRAGRQTALAWGWRVARLVEEQYAILAPATRQVETAYSLLPFDPVSRQAGEPYAIRAARSIETPYSLMARLRRQVDEPYNDMTTAAAQVEEPYTASARAARQAGEPYALRPLNRVEMERLLLYAMPATQVFIRTAAPIIIFNGRTIRLVTFSVRASEGDYAWTLDAALADPADYAAMRVDDPFILDAYGEQYSFIVDSKSVSRGGPANVQFQLAGISPTAARAFPRAAKLTKTWGQVMARQAAAEALGAAIDWLIPDWSIPADRLAVVDAEPVAVAKQIVEAAGGVLETKKDGTWLARPAYPVSVPDWDTAVPAHVLTDEADNLSAQEMYQRADRFNEVTIRDMSGGGSRDQTEYVADEANPLRGTLRVYAWPWRPIEVAHTGHAAVGLTPQGEQLVSRRELVEFIAGRASVQYPVYAIDEVKWQYADLGAVAGSGAELTAAKGGYSLAWIDYTARAHEFAVSDTMEETIQFLVMEK